MSNGRIEGTNNLLQVLRRTAQGFTNPHNLTRTDSKISGNFTWHRIHRKDSRSRLIHPTVSKLLVADDPQSPYRDRLKQFITNAPLEEGIAA